MKKVIDILIKGMKRVRSLILIAIIGLIPLTSVLGQYPIGILPDQDFIVAPTAQNGDNIGEIKISPTVVLENKSFSITSGNTDGAFTLNSSNGTLTVSDASKLNYSVKNSYTLNVEVRHLAGTETCQATINVLDPSRIVYIDPTNSNSSGQNGTYANPYSSWSSVSISDNRVYLQKRGTSAIGGITISGRNNVVFGAYGVGNRPVAYSNTSRSKTFDISHSKNIVVRDFETYSVNNVAVCGVSIAGSEADNVRVVNVKVRNAEWGIRAFLNASNISLEFCEVHDILDDGVFFQRIENVTISYSVVYKVNKNYVAPNTPQTIAAGDGIQFVGCYNWHVFHNFIDRGDTGNKFAFIASNGNNGILEYNIIKSPIGTSEGGSAIYIYNGDKHTIRNNRIFLNGLPAIHHHAPDLLFHNNVVTGNGTAMGNYGPTPTKVYHNVFYNVSEGIKGTSEIKNNIFYNVGEPVITHNYTESYNLFFASPFTGRNAVYSNPQFVNPAEHDFRISNGSPAQNAGTSTVVTKDFENKNVPSGSAPDIGLFEINGTLAPAVPQVPADILDFDEDLVENPNPPGIPDTPDVPDSPDSPDNPDTPNPAPGTPANPGTPDETEIPDVQSTYRINSAGDTYTTASGATFSSDLNHLYKGGNTYNNTQVIGNTDDDALYLSHRYGSNFSYNLPVDNGRYKIRLHFAENYWTNENDRIFNVRIENKQVLENFSIMKEAGGRNIALIKEFKTDVTDQELDIEFTTVTDNAMISAIEIIPENTVGISNNKKAELLIYPIPSYNYINVELSIIPEESIEVSVTDIAGKVMLTNVMDRGQSRTSFDISSLKAGMYILFVKLPDELVTQKIVKR